MNSYDIIQRLQNSGFNKIIRKPSIDGTQKESPNFINQFREKTQYQVESNAKYLEKFGEVLSVNTIRIPNETLFSDTDIFVYINGIIWNDYIIVNKISNVDIKLDKLPYDLSNTDQITVFAYFEKP